MPGLSPAAALCDAAVRELARSADGTGSLDEPDGSAAASNPMCGDEVRVEIRRAGGSVAQLAHRTRGCLLCRASAALLARQAQHCAGSPVQLRALAAELAALLGAGSPSETFALFAPVANRPSRKGCVLLPWQALEQALADCGLDAG